ncbi:hypothetical protein [Peribacillus phoenicis]|uniref:hypothetical protein n=1 Tax=Peribacillus sp. 1P06PA-2 TaxID=3132295 RepID=UPI0039A75D06
MTYEWGYQKGPPQAISPINQIKRVLNYTVTVIPTNKILMGFQIYARDWLVPQNWELLGTHLLYGNCRVFFNSKRQS